jgi:hypothetical protein
MPEEPGLKAAFIRGCFFRPEDRSAAALLLRDRNILNAQHSRFTRIPGQAPLISCYFPNHSNI